MNAWSHLPNAAYIDRILESLKTHNDIWTETYDGTRIQAQYAAWAEAWNAAMNAAMNAARGAAWYAAGEEVRYSDHNQVDHAALNATRIEVLDEAWSSIAALIAWDDSDQFLEMTEDALEVWIRISDDPRAVLLLPAVRVFERINELETL